jgi:uncharacterized protein YjbJ (UPF0337 family)
MAGSAANPKKESKKESFMNWDQLEGNWKQLKGALKQQWGKLTDNDLEYIAGKRDKFAGKLQERYGLSKEEAERRADDWISAQPGMAAGREQHSTAKG